MFRGNDGNEIMIMHQAWLVDNLLEAAAHYCNTDVYRRRTSLNLALNVVSLQRRDMSGVWDRPDSQASQKLCS